MNRIAVGGLLGSDGEVQGLEGDRVPLVQHPQRVEHPRGPCDLGDGRAPAPRVQCPAGLVVAGRRIAVAPVEIPDDGVEAIGADDRLVEDHESELVVVLCLPTLLVAERQPGQQVLEER